MIRVVVVDDSAFMRKAIATMLEKDPLIRVVGSAKNGEEGLQLVREHEPDVVTLDIEMPVMDGLTALRHIMMEMPRPVLMVSSLTTEGAEATLKAMELGAVDFIPKQLSKVSLDIVKIEADLIAKVKAIAGRRMRPVSHARPAPVSLPKVAPERIPTARPWKTTPTTAAGAAPAPRGGVQREVVAIGVSTGGPPAVQKIMAALPADFPSAILIAQHMPAAFTGPFAERLNGLSKLTIKEAEDGDPVRPGHVYVAPGGKHMTLERRATGMIVRVGTEPASALYKPSVDVLVSSVAGAAGRRALAVILTGMGSDGMLGVRECKARGGLVLAQSDATCVVYGMPKAVVEDGTTDRVVDLDDMAAAIVECLYR
ncbi:MAG: chemotaxis response regulator protein-glutamate methylesterase [Desulfovibrionaceae bacterium]